MVKWLKKWGFSSSDKAIVRNMSSLMSSQAINYILPLLTYPFLIKKIGLSHFGEVQFLLTVMMFLNLLIDYGFNYRAPREVAFLRKDVNELSGFVSRIVFFKLSLFAIISLCVLLFAILISKEPLMLYMGGLVFLLNIALTPNWFFQGVERMEFIAGIDVVAKIIFTGLIFVFIDDMQDYVYILLLWGLGGIISIIAGGVLIYSKYKIRYVKPEFSKMKNEVKEGYHLFIANLSALVLTNSQIILLGIYQGPWAVGIYSVAEKIAKIPWTLCGIFSNVIYPKVCIESKISFENVKVFLNNAMRKVMIFVFVGVIILFIFGRYIVSIFAKDEIISINNVFKILILSTIFVALNIPYNLTLLAYGQNKVLMKIFIVTALFNIFISNLLIYYFDTIGAAISHFTTVVILLVLLYISATRKEQHETI